MYILSFVHFGVCFKRKKHEDEQLGRDPGVVGKGKQCDLKTQLYHSLAYSLKTLHPTIRTFDQQCS